MLNQHKALRAAASLVAIRAALWVAAALALVWAPSAAERVDVSAYGGWSDFLARTFAQWDARWFVEIAQNGYGGVEGTAAFFPLYPALVHALAWVTGSTAVAGIVLSLAGGAVAAAVLAELGRPLVGARAAGDAVLFLALYPVGYVFTAVYSDGLFVALAAGAFLAAQRGRPLLAGVLTGLACGTRLLGLALVPALALLLGRRPLRLAPLLLGPAAVALYALYLHVRVGDAGAFAGAQTGWDRHLSAAGPLGGLWDAMQAAGRGARMLATLPADPGHGERVALWNVSHLGLLVLAGWLTWVAWRRVGAAYGAYSAATLAVVLSVPATGFPLVSLPRFLLADFPLFLAAAALVAERPRARDAVVAALAALGAAAAVAFSRGVWVA